MTESTDLSSVTRTRRKVGMRTLAAIVGMALFVPLALSTRGADRDPALSSTESTAARPDAVDQPTSVEFLAPQTPGPSPSAVSLPVPAGTTAEMKSTRALLGDYLDQLQDLVDREQFAAPGDPQLRFPATDLSSAVDAARSLVDELDGVELLALEGFIAANPAFEDQPAALDRAVRSNPFDLNSVGPDGRDGVLGEFETPTGLRHAGDQRPGVASEAARIAADGLAPVLIAANPSPSSGPTPGFLSPCIGTQPDIKALFYSYWAAAQIYGGWNAVAAGIPSSTTYAALTIVTGVALGVAGAIMIALEYALTLAQDCAAAADNATFRSSLPTDPTAVGDGNPEGFTPASTQTSVDELGNLIAGVAESIDRIDAEIVQILADQRVVIEALGLAQVSALQIQTIGVSLQTRARDLRANVGAPDDAAAETNRDVVCVWPDAPPGLPDPTVPDPPCNTAIGLANTIDERLDTILSDTADLEIQTLRTAIERALADPSQPAIGLFALPEAQGGQLETVAAIVTDTLNNLRAAGQGIGNAETTLATANESFVAGQFSRAYAEYARAYRDAVR